MKNWYSNNVMCQFLVTDDNPYSRHLSIYQVSILYRDKPEPSLKVSFFSAREVQGLVVLRSHVRMVEHALTHAGIPGCSRVTAQKITQEFIAKDMVRNLYLVRS